MIIKSICLDNLDTYNDNMLLQSLKERICFNDDSYNYMELGINISKLGKEFVNSIDFIVNGIVNNKEGIKRALRSISSINLSKYTKESLEFWASRVLIISKSKYENNNSKLKELFSELLYFINYSKIDNPLLIIKLLSYLSYEHKVILVGRILGIGNLNQYKSFVDSFSIIKDTSELSRIRKEVLNDIFPNDTNANLVTLSRKNKIVFDIAVYSNSEFIEYEDLMTYVNFILTPNSLGKTKITKSNLITLNSIINLIKDEKSFDGVVQTIHRNLIKNYSNERSIISIFELNKNSSNSIIEANEEIGNKQRLLLPKTIRNLIEMDNFNVINKLFGITKFSLDEVIRITT